MGILTSTFRQSYHAATPENPRFSLNDSAAWDALGVSKSAAGIAINREIALTYSPWFRGVTLISNDVAKLPLHVYQESGAGRERAIDHPAYRLLRRKPNERQTAYAWKRQAIAHAMSEGNAYSYITRDGAGRPLELLPLDPTCTVPLVVNGQLWYVTKVGAEDRKIRAEDMFHVHGTGYDGLCGYAVWEKAKDSLGLGIGTKRYITTVLKNNGRPSIILQHPLKLQPPTVKALIEGWDRMNAGIDNAGRTAVLDQGMTAKEISFSPRNNENSAVMEFQIRDIANFLGIAPHKIGDTSRTAYSSLEQENLSYLSEGLDPWLVNIEDQAHDKLLTEEEKAGDTHEVEFDRRAILLGDRTSRANYFRTALGGAPWMTQNEVRGEEGLEPTDDGDEIKDPLNMGGADKEPKQTPAPAPKEDGAARAMIEDASRRMVRRLKHSAAKAAKRPAEFLAWLDGMTGEHLGTVEEVLAHWQPSGAALLMDAIHADLLEVSGQCKAADLAARVDGRMLTMETVLPPRVADFILGKENQ